MTRKKTPRTGKSNSIACPSSNIISRRSFVAYRERLFYFSVTVLFCWVRFWETAARDFLRFHPVTYFVLYTSLLVLARWVGIA